VQVQAYIQTLVGIRNRREPRQSFTRVAETAGTPWHCKTAGQVEHSEEWRQ